MKIKLTVAGGLLPLVKEAEKEIDIPETEWSRWIQTVEQHAASRALVRDGKTFILSRDGQEWSVDPSKFSDPPPAWFTDLVAALKRVTS